MTVGDGTLIVPPQPEIMIESRVPMHLHPQSHESVLGID